MVPVASTRSMIGRLSTAVTTIAGRFCVCSVLPSPVAASAAKTSPGAAAIKNATEKRSAFLFPEAIGRLSQKHDFLTGCRALVDGIISPVLHSRPGLADTA